MCQVVHQSGGCSSKGMQQEELQQEGKFADEGEGEGGGIPSLPSIYFLRNLFHKSKGQAGLQIDPLMRVPKQSSCRYWNHCMPWCLGKKKNHTTDISKKPHNHLRLQIFVYNDVYLKYRQSSCPGISGGGGEAHLLHISHQRDEHRH